MKKLYLGLLLILFSFSLLPAIRAQSTETNDSKKRASYYSSNDQPVVNGNNWLNEINVRAYKYFLQNYPNVTGEKWVKISTGICVCFGDGSIITKLYFNIYGVFQYSEKVYYETNLKSDLKTLVSIRYPAYRINIIRELCDGNQSVYEMHISDSKTIKVIDIKNNEIECVGDYLRG